MGCDIHMHVEVFDGDHWRYLEPESVGATRNPYADDPDSDGYSSPWRVSRDYALFAVLAGVRNRGGFIVPISEPRGIPSDATTQVQVASAVWGSDGHSHSWVGLGELDAYPHWNEVHRMVGWPAWPGDAWCDQMDALRTIAHPVRLVFWFDN